MNLFQEFEERKIDYATIEVDKFAYVKQTDILVIIPVHGRTQFNHVVTDAFDRVRRNSGLKIDLIIVEHSEYPEHKKLCRSWVNYVWIPQNGQRFNKCLCFNMGILHGPKSLYYLFHDGDILVPRNFDNLLMENMRNFNAVQAFSGQRLFHCSRDLTESILNDKLDIGELSIDNKEISPARSGAEGGSIFVEYGLVQRGCVFPDWACTEYSIEDSFYFRSLQLIGHVGFCNQPPIDCLHLWHEASFGRQTKKEDWLRYHAFMAMNEEGRRHLLKLQSDHFNKYYHVA